MRRIRGLVAGAALVAAACGDGGSATPTTKTTPPTMAAADLEVGSVEEVVPTTFVNVANVRLRGSLASVADGPLRFCRRAAPAGCFDSIILDGADWGDAPVAANEELWGRWNPARVVVDGVMRGDGSVAVTDMRAEDAFTPEAAACPDLTTDDYPSLGGLTDEEVTRQVIEYTLTIRDQLGGEITFDGRRGIRIIRVIDDPAPHQAALDAVAPGHTCVIQVANGRHELGLVRIRLEELRPEWESRGYGTSSVGVQTGANLVTVDAEQVDERIWDDIDVDREVVWLRAHVEVRDAESVDALDAAVAPAPAADRSRLFTSCRNLPVDPAVFEAPADDHLDGHPSNAVFEQTEMPGVPQPDGGEGWWRAYEGVGRALYVSESGASLETVGSAGVWSWAGSGGCRLGLADPLGLSLALWRPVDVPGPSSTEVVVEFFEGGCASGQQPGERVLDPVVEESEDRIVITIFIVPPDGAQTCPSSPRVELAIPLEAAVGDRVLVDGARWPIEPVS